MMNFKVNPLPERLGQDGWFIGVQAYTFKEFSAFEAIGKIKEAGGNMVEFYPGQKLKPNSTQIVHHTMSDVTMVDLQAECFRQGVHAASYGVVDARSEEDVRAIMNFARKMGLYSVCTEAVEQIVAWEEGAIASNVKVAFHQHGGSMSEPGYKVWNPLYILGVVEGRDRRLGACADLGHWSASNLNPVECLRILSGRIISAHFKDKAESGNAPVVVAGKGVVDVAGCLEELKRQKFDGHILIEHENDWNDNIAEVSANIAFIANTSGVPRTAESEDFE